MMPRNVSGSITPPPSADPQQQSPAPIPLSLIFSMPSLGQHLDRPCDAENPSLARIFLAGERIPRVAWTRPYHGRVRLIIGEGSKTGQAEANGFSPHALGHLCPLAPRQEMSGENLPPTCWLGLIPTRLARDRSYPTIPDLRASRHRRPRGVLAAKPSPPA